MSRRANEKAHVNGPLSELLKHDQKYAEKEPSRLRPYDINVETVFDEFVTSFGGIKISSLISNKAMMPKNADYIFYDHNTIIELKTLEGIYSGHSGMVTLKQAFIDSGITNPGQVIGHIFNGDIPPQVAALVQRRMRRAFEDRIKQARKQLRVSKAQFGNTETALIILFAMDETPIFGHRNMLLILSKIMGDNYRDLDTDGVIYINPNRPTKLHSESMSYSGWYPFYRDDEVNDKLSDFVDLLGNEWLKFYARLTDNRTPIFKTDSVDVMTFVLSDNE